MRFVGEAVALVVADSAAAAQDAAELVEVEYRDLPPVVQPEDALAPGAPQLHDNVPGNLSLEAEAGDAAAVEAAFARAAHVTRLKVEVTRVSPNPMEPRACMVTYDARDGSYTIHTSACRASPRCASSCRCIRGVAGGHSCISWRATSAAVSASARRPIPSIAR